MQIQIELCMPSEEASALGVHFLVEVFFTHEKVQEAEKVIVKSNSE